MQKPISAVRTDQGWRIVALAGLLLVGLVAVLNFSFGPGPGAALTTVMIIFAVLGILVSRDAPRWGLSGLGWGFITLITGPFGVIIYVWAKWGATSTRSPSPYYPK